MNTALHNETRRVNTNENVADLLPTRRSLLSRLRDWDDQES